MLREYEFTYIVKSDLAEQDKTKLIDKYEGILLKDGGKVVRKDDWGVRKLAYPIQKQFRGHYVHYDFLGDPTHLAEVERLMRIDTNVLRFLSIRIGDECDVESRRQVLAKKYAAIQSKQREYQQ